jgi:kynurenine 3-monooxygenase
MPNVTIFFNHKLVGADFKKRLAWFEIWGTVTKEIEVSFDFMIGADGAHSAVRYHMMKFTRMSYQQEYVDTLWCEFRIDAKTTADGAEFKLSPNHLHIWPGGSFMFIAIPSLDKSFTCTLFLSESRFAELDANTDDIVPFFKENFAGVVPDLIHEDQIVAQYLKNPHLPLISIRCTPHHFASSAVILGDAAHAMVPFYGQGMNAGLEDVRVLYDHLDAYMPPPSTFLTTASSLDELASHRATALRTYTQTRVPDATAIRDLALANYAEMSSHVTSPLYLARKYVEERLSAYVPRLGWATQYSRVSFGNERYSVVRASARRQQMVLRGVVGGVLAGLLGGAVVWGSGWRMATGWSWRRVARLFGV